MFVSISDLVDMLGDMEFSLDFLDDDRLLLALACRLVFELAVAAPMLVLLLVARFSVPAFSLLMATELRMSEVLVFDESSVVLVVLIEAGSLRLRLLGAVLCRELFVFGGSAMSLGRLVKLNSLLNASTRMLVMVFSNTFSTRDPNKGEVKLENEPNA